MGNPVFQEKQDSKKMSFLRQVIRRSFLNHHSRRQGTSSHPLRSLLEDPLESLASEADTRSALNRTDAADGNLDELESMLLDTINPRIINLSVGPLTVSEESPEESRLSSLMNFEDLFGNRSRNANNFPLPNATRFARTFSPSISFHRWQSLRTTRPLSSSIVPSRIPRASIFQRNSDQSNSRNDNTQEIENNQN